MPEQPAKRSYKDTLNLPSTKFPMKANLVQNEPATLKRWQKMGLYELVRQAPHPAGRYVFHDGPPYANGSIHLGHLLNKVLKDLVVRAKTMAGFDVPYIPGWDCHGLPIESKVLMDAGPKARTMEPFQVRRKCHDSAEKFIKLQMAQMERLLTLADYAHPYQTMAPEYEAGVLEVFADLVGKGLVYRALKPVHWSIDNRTALAEAELEYYDREDTSVYVLFEVTQPRKLPAGLNVPADLSGGGGVHLMIWTTTPWTLPANLAVAVLASAPYGLYRFTQSGQNPGARHAVLAEALAEKVLALGGATGVQRLGTCDGAALEAAGVTYRHPFLDRTSPIVTAPYVTLEDGTGLVHTAPGHGVEDYQTGLRVGLPIYCPVREDGTFDDTAPEWLRGRTVWQANDLVVARLRESDSGGGHLFHDHKFTHSYPHDWRGKTPVIFRATEQWFIGVDRAFAPTSGAAAPGQARATGATTLRELALRVTAGDVQFLPEWGRNRMRGMLESRPDWCISRQRAWGLPIPAFFPPEGVAVPEGQRDFLLTPASVRAVADKARRHGSDFWFKATPVELLALYEPSRDADCPDWLGELCAGPQGREALGSLRKGGDIFDVWFESGSSWYAVMVQRGLAHDPRTQPVTDLYLEGSDQHRGWFQTSLLPALGMVGQSPFATVLTHGFMVDKDGRKMSKSLGNTLEVEALLKDFGADVCRWWVSSLNTDNDIKVDPEFFKLAGEEYRKVRNTIKYLLSNLYDFNPRLAAGPESAEGRPLYTFTDQDATSLDAWALSELAKLVREVRAGYDGFDFRRLHETIFNFCNQTLSAVYLAATKDRMYCDRPDSPRRRRSQTAMYLITEALIRLLAPILPHTAEEAWAALHGGNPQPVSVHLALLPEANDYDVPVSPAWAQLMAERDGVLKVIETARGTQGIDNPLDIGLAIDVGEKARWLHEFDPVDLADVLSISRVTLADAATDAGEAIYVARDLRSEPRCDRSWKRDGTVQPRSDGGMLSDRDAAALGLA